MDGGTLPAWIAARMAGSTVPSLAMAVERSRGGGGEGDGGRTCQGRAVVLYTKIKGDTYQDVTSQQIIEQHHRGTSQGIL